MRVWFLKETDSICTSCGRGCNVTIGSRLEEVYRLTPRDNNDVNSAWMCDHGRLNFHYLNSELRLTDPLVRGEEGHSQTSWQEAIQIAGDQLHRYGANEVAVIASARLTNEELFMARRLADALHTEFVDVVPRSGEADNYLVAADRNPNTTGAKLILGIEEPGKALADIRKGIEQGRIRALVVLQENLINDAGFTAEELGKLDFLLVTYPLANPTAEVADVVLPGAAFAEKRGSMINVTGRLQRLNKANDGPGQTRGVWEIVRDLIQSVGGGNGIYSVDEVFKQLAAEVKEFEGLTLASIGDQGLPILETGETIPLLERERERIAKGIVVG
ncbi:MAG: molybdopterin-dependent oxidoreductase, partial [Verrucomicrobiae bacterium]|nr:molybdopterin-dependent oxidoreductase [Verrucomicrobiae bacterium]